MNNIRLYYLPAFVMVLLAGLLACNSYASDHGAFSTSQVCKAGISTVMGSNPSTMQIDRIVGEVVYLSYIRKSDGKRWAYKCKLNGNRIIWGADDGRWRTHPEDSILTFTVGKDAIQVEDRFSDGSSIKKSFQARQLGSR